MTIDEAIEIEEAYMRGDEPDDPRDLIKADRLGIEALKEVQRLRSNKAFHVVKLLSRETEK